MAVPGMQFVGFNPTLIVELETRAGRGFEGLSGMNLNLRYKTGFENQPNGRGQHY
jgi:hypothetical protein